MVPDTDIIGVADNWDDCKKIVIRTSGAKYKGFKTKKEAEDWLEQGANYSIGRSTLFMADGKRSRTTKKRLTKGIYFDAGTGRGQGVEISVTDEKGNNLLETLLPKKHINRHGKHLIGNYVTNNYGELLACNYALQLALREGITRVFGDSKLVITYWSRGHIKNEVAAETIKLAHEVAGLRHEFELKGGKLTRISGDDNPADLGFHR